MYESWAAQLQEAVRPLSVQARVVESADGKPTCIVEPIPITGTDDLGAQWLMKIVGDEDWPRLHLEMTLGPLDLEHDWESVTRFRAWLNRWNMRSEGTAASISAEGRLFLRTTQMLKESSLDENDMDVYFAREIVQDFGRQCERFLITVELPPLAKERTPADCEALDE